MPLRRREHGNTESVDNYLKAIFSLGGVEGARVTIKSLSERLEVAPASVTNMLQKLSGAGVPPVEYERHRGVQLSPAGRRRALEVVRHHRLIETFLFEVLDYRMDEVHEEAERLEHFISEQFRGANRGEAGASRDRSARADDSEYGDGGAAGEIGWQVGRGAARRRGPAWNNRTENRCR